MNRTRLTGKERAALRLQIVQSAPRQPAKPVPGAAPPVKWQRFKAKTPPPASGIYAIRSGSRWLYIGSSLNIARRLKNPAHPARITQGIHLPFWFQWHPHPPEGLRTLEARLIRQHAPEWNGGTEWSQFDGPTCAIPPEQLPETSACQEAADQARHLLFASEGQ